jgi:protease PrsW
MPVYTLTILCAAALVAWIYHYDRYEKEPWYAIAVAVAWGFAAMWMIGLIDDAVLSRMNFDSEHLASKAAAIAFIEEAGKFLAILLLSIVLAREFNDPMDGLIYGRLIGLGMAVQESLLYLGISPPTLQTWGIEIVRLFGHSLMGALVGFGIGLGAHPRHRRQNYPLLAGACLLLSMLLHFGWDWVAYGSQTLLIHQITPVLLMAGMLLMWHVLCAVCEARSKRLFAANCP